MGSEGGSGGMCEKKKNGEIFWGGGEDGRKREPSDGDDARKVFVPRERKKNMKERSDTLAEQTRFFVLHPFFPRPRPILNPPITKFLRLLPIPLQFILPVPSIRMQLPPK